MKRMLAWGAAAAAAAGGIAVAGFLFVNKQDRITSGPGPTKASPFPSPSFSPIPSLKPRPANVKLPRGKPLSPNEMVVSLLGPVVEADIRTVTISIIDARDGSVRRELAQTDTVEGGVLDLEVTADRRTVLATIATSACESKLMAYAADGSSPEGVDLGFGEEVGASPDGKRLVVAFDADCDADSTFELFTLAGDTPPVYLGCCDKDHKAGHWEFDTANGIDDAVWVSNNLLVYILVYEDGTEHFVLDLADVFAGSSSEPKSRQLMTDEAGLDVNIYPSFAAIPGGRLSAVRNFGDKALGELDLQTGQFTSERDLPPGLNITDLSWGPGKLGPAWVEGFGPQESPTLWHLVKGQRVKLRDGVTASAWGRG